MSGLLIDTCIWVDLFRSRVEAVRYIEGLSERPMVSALIVAELFAGAKGKVEERKLEYWVRSVEVIEVDGEIGKAAGQLKAKYGPSHGTGLADAVIAATASSRGAQLVTLNAKHFPMLDIVKPY